MRWHALGHPRREWPSPAILVIAQSIITYPRLNVRSSSNCLWNIVFTRTYALESTTLSSGHVLRIPGPKFIMFACKGYPPTLMKLRSELHAVEGWNFYQDLILDREKISNLRIEFFYDWITFRRTFEFWLIFIFHKITSFELRNFINLIVFPYILTQRHIYIVYLRCFTFLSFLSSPQPRWNFGIGRNKDKFRMMKLRYIQRLSLSFLSTPAWILKSAGPKVDNNKSDNFLFPSFPLFPSFFLKVKLESTRNQNYVIVLHFLLYIPSIFLSVPSFLLYSFPLHFFFPYFSFLLLFSSISSPSLSYLSSRISFLVSFSLLLLIHSSSLCPSFHHIRTK